MPRLSLYRQQKSNDYRFIDRTVKEQFIVGGTDLFVHKYLGPVTSTTTDATQPTYDDLKPTNVGDLLFLENRNRKYDNDVYVIRGHYNVQNLDFDMSQFGLFLTNDVIFITVHYNNMLDHLGRKLMVGDVIELPHLTDYHPLNEEIPIGLRRYYHVTDGNYASEGFSSTWYPHLWRIKCEPLSDVQEFSTILNKPVQQDNYLGQWDSTLTYRPGYTVTYGDKTYIATQNVPANTPVTDTDYWQLDTTLSLTDILSTYNNNIKINDALIEQAINDVPRSGYDRTQLYLVPSETAGTPLYQTPTPVQIAGRLDIITSSTYSPSAVIRISAASLSQYDQIVISPSQILRLELCEIPPEVIGNSGRTAGESCVLSTVIGTASSNFTTTDPTVDPRFAYVMSTANAEGFGELYGYMTSSIDAPNGVVADTGTSFPDNQPRGTWFVRTDYKPARLFMFDGKRWVAKSDDIRTSTGFTVDDTSLRSTFINTTTTITTQNGVIPERQALSTLLKIQPD